MAKKYVVVNIGCIECGVSSGIVGVFADQKRAYDVAGACRDRYNWREGGQNAFEVFELPEAEIINPDYNEIKEVKDDKVRTLAA
jgi:hypothetical protein